MQNASFCVILDQQNALMITLPDCHKLYYEL